MHLVGSGIVAGFRGFAGSATTVTNGFTLRLSLTAHSATATAATAATTATTATTAADVHAAAGAVKATLTSSRPVLSTTDTIASAPSAGSGGVGGVDSGGGGGGGGGGGEEGLRKGRCRRDSFSLSGGGGRVGGYHRFFLLSGCFLLFAGKSFFQLRLILLRQEPSAHP